MDLSWFLFIHLGVIFQIYFSSKIVHYMTENIQHPALQVALSLVHRYIYKQTNKHKNIRATLSLVWTLCIRQNSRSDLRCPQMKQINTHRHSSAVMGLVLWVCLSQTDLQVWSRDLLLYFIKCTGELITKKVTLSQIKLEIYKYIFLPHSH